MSFNPANLLEIIKLISKKKISIYEAVDFVKDNSEKFVNELKKLLNHDKSYYRLFAAWSIGEIRNQGSFNLLCTRYIKEKDPNVRANLVRSLFYINPKKISYRMMKKILEDNYEIVHLVLIKFFILCKQLHNKLNFKYYFQRIHSNLVKYELLRNINLFRYQDKSMLLFLSNILTKSKNQLLKNEIIKSIGAINSPNSIDTLLEYYHKNKSLFKYDTTLTYSFVVAVVSLCTSKAYHELYEAYFNHNNTLVKYKVIEALSSGGGPQSLMILKKILMNENDEKLILELKNQIKTIKVLDI